MESYVFPHFQMEWKYPESSATVQFGRGYQFASRPKGPDQITMVLHYSEGMRFFTAPPAPAMDVTTLPTWNMELLRLFYERHRLYKPFQITYYGTLYVVRFAKPLTWKLVRDGRGLVEPFTVELITQP